VTFPRASRGRPCSLSLKRSLNGAPPSGEKLSVRVRGIQPISRGNSRSISFRFAHEDGAPVAQPLELYSKPARNAVKGTVLMIRSSLFAVILLQSTAVLGQSMVTPSGSSQVPGKTTAVQWPFDFSNSQTGQTAARPAFKSFDCHGAKTTRDQASAPADFNHLFYAPCTDLKTHADLFAHNEIFALPTPLVVPPHLKGAPIPTQWPNAKVERIPTQWPNLKLQPIDGGSPGLAPAHSSGK
jgi:hypothetical protein